MDFKEMDKRELQEEIKKGHYPPDTTLDEYYYLVNKRIDQIRGK